MTSTAINIDSTALRNLMTDVFSALGVPGADCDVLVDALLEASLAGYDSHGIMRVHMFHGDIRSGEIVPDAAVQTLNETASSAYLDANHGIGPVAATTAVTIACEKAAQTGVGCVSVTRSNDIARLGGYLRQPAMSGLVTMIMVNDGGGGPVVAPWGSAQPFLSTNPLAAGIPWRSDLPIIIDLSTSVVSGGRLKMLASRDEEPPEGWLIGRDGRATTDIESFFATPQASALLPLGGLDSGHKGFALSVLVDILAGALGGFGCSAGKWPKGNKNGIFVLAIDPEKFASRETFARTVGEFVENLKNCERTPDVEEILLPGERSHRERQRRLENGIPVQLPVWKEVTEILDELGLKGKYDA